MKTRFMSENSQLEKVIKGTPLKFYHMTGLREIMFWGFFCTIWCMPLPVTCKQTFSLSSHSVSPDDYFYCAKLNAFKTFKCYVSKTFWT
jgi:hypothetical protein